ncbi:MAG: solute:Na+ symporter, family [Actinomycetota bacterium]|nr:solute:Na+ symporter, family [Actinomycetota bacterium]
MNKVEFSIVLVLFVIVTVMGFMAARWRRRDTLHNLDEWGLGGRSFGTWVTWFLLGGDLYTAYTFVAVPALVFGAGALGFFAVPYTIMVYPLVFFAATRLWSVAHRQGYVTAADFVRGRHGSNSLGVAVAITGIVATMPYIALQMVGIQAVVEAIGINGNHWPLVIAFIVLAAYTYSSGLRAPALIAFVKDTLIYIVVIVAVIYIPYKLGGYGKIFDAAAKALPTKPSHGAITLKNTQYLAYSTLALGSAMALFLYPHSTTAVLAARSRNTVKKNMALLPAYSLMLGFLALLGYMAIAAKVAPVKGTNGKPDSNTIVPVLFDHQFPSWFAGIAMGAIAIGALVPAAIMSIAAANTFTRDIYKPYFRPNASPKEEAQVSKIMSLLVKFGALLVILFVDVQFALDFQLIGGIIIIQILPAVVLGLYTRWFHRWALLAGWAVGIATSVWMLWYVPNPLTNHKHFGGAQWALSHIGMNTKAAIWIGIPTVVINLIVATLLTLLFSRLPRGVDATNADDYHAEAGDPRVVTLPVSAEERLAMEHEGRRVR